MRLYWPKETPPSILPAGSGPRSRHRSPQLRSAVIFLSTRLTETDLRLGSQSCVDNAREISERSVLRTKFSQNGVMGNRRHKEDNSTVDLLLDLAKSAVAEWTLGRNNRQRGLARQAGVTVKWLTRAVKR